jgi:hypothetical protein
MKRNYIATIVSTAILLFASCAKDNYEPPESDFTGRFVYQGQPLYFQQGNFNAELWQRGFGNYGVINVNVNQEGQFASKLFDGNYKFTISNAQTAFVWPRNSAGRPDSLDVNLSGDKVMDMEVMPYFMIRNSNITVSGGAVRGTCSVEKIVQDTRTVESVTLYINKTQFVDSRSDNNIANNELTGAALANLSNLSMTVNIPAIVPTQNYVYARIGVKISGIENRIFGPLTRLTF